MSAIGPGDFVIAVHSWSGGVFASGITKGAIYQVARVVVSPWLCLRCGEHGDAIQLVGGAYAPQCGVCRCELAPWPGPADEAVISEPTDEPVSVQA